MFRLLLKHAPTDQTATITFSSWTREQPENAASRIVTDYPADPDAGSHDFSMQLRDVTFQRVDEYPPVVIRNRVWKDSPAQVKLKISWEISESPVGKYFLLCIPPEWVAF